MEKRCICLQGTEGQEEQRIIEVMHGNSVVSQTQYCCGHAGETKEISMFREMNKSCLS